MHLSLHYGLVGKLISMMKSPVHLVYKKCVLSTRRWSFPLKEPTFTLHLAELFSQTPYFQHFLKYYHGPRHNQLVDHGLTVWCILLFSLKENTSFGWALLPLANVFLAAFELCVLGKKTPPPPFLLEKSPSAHRTSRGHAKPWIDWTKEVPTNINSENAVFYLKKISFLP